MTLTLVDFTGVMKCFARPTGPVRQIDGIWQELAQGARGGGSPLAYAGGSGGAEGSPRWGGQFRFFVRQR